MAGKTLALTVTCDQPSVTALDVGAWNLVPRRRQVAVPYYTGAVHYLPRENLFVNTMLDWTASAASSHNGTSASYDRRTDGTRAQVRERAIFCAAWHLAEVLPNPPNPPSPWRAFLANKIVLDIWGGTFTNIAANLSPWPTTASPTASRSSMTGSGAATTMPCPCTTPPTPPMGATPA